MSKKSKKRTKRYQGEDAKQDRPTSSEPVIHRYEAVERSRAGDWWHAKKRSVKIGGIIALILAGGGWLVVELIQIVL